MISILITNYNTWDLCLRSIDSITAEELKYLSEIIIVDDASDQSPPKELVEHPLVRIQENRVNKGYAACVNQAFELAKESICLLLDSDAYLISGTKFILEQFSKHPQLGILALKLVDEHGKTTGRAEPEVKVWGLLLGQQLDAKIGKYLYKPSNNWSIFSCGMAVRKEAFIAVNGFDTAFDFLDADHDFSMKINRSGWKISFEDQCVIYHVGNGSPQSTAKRVIRFYKNRRKLLCKYDLYNYPKLFDGLIYTRVSLEKLVLKFLKLISNDNEILSDKILSRQNILFFLRNNDK